MFIAKPSDPKICPLDRAFFKISCQVFQQLEFFSKEKTPMLMCGAKAIFLAIDSEKPDFFACL